jgi:hypothetical protein
VGRNISPKRYRHPNESLKIFVAVSIVFCVPTFLRVVASMNRWLALAVGMACALVVFQLIPPRLTPVRFALAAVSFCLIFAVYFLVCLHFHLNW